MDVQPSTPFKEQINRLGLKNTRQRNIILDIFNRARQHLTADEVLLEARQSDPKLSLATVYRTLRLLESSGWLAMHQFGNGQAVFERVGGTESHHDHLICIQCGRIIEFFNEEMEKLQKEIAFRYQFTVRSHRMELYGWCSECSCHRSSKG